MEVKGEQFGIEEVDEAVDGGGELFRIELLGQLPADGSLAIVRDAHAVAEHGEQRLLAGHQVGLHELLADGVTGVDPEGFVNPCILLGEGFLLNEDRAELAVCRQRGDGRLVNIAVIDAEPIEHLGDKGGVNGGVNFVGFHGRNEEVR